MTFDAFIGADRQRLQGEFLAQAARDRLIAQLPHPKPAPGIAALLVRLLVSHF